VAPIGGAIFNEMSNAFLEGLRHPSILYITFSILYEDWGVDLRKIDYSKIPIIATAATLDKYHHPAFSFWIKKF
jgi:hypothetical protein